MTKKDKEKQHIAHEHHLVRCKDCEYKDQKWTSEPCHGCRFWNAYQNEKEGENNE